MQTSHINPSSIDDHSVLVSLGVPAVVAGVALLGVLSLIAS